jgi:hypothetical protein
VLEHAAQEVAGHVRELCRAAGVVEDVVALVVDQREVVVVSVRRDARERLGHEARQQAVLAPDGGAHLAVGGDVVGRPDRTVEAEVQLELAGGVLVIAVAHVQPERLAVLDHVE